MKCPRCEHENPQGARFCEECATALAGVCANCATALSATAKFCHACAHPVASAADRTTPSPERYTPQHLAEKILTSRSALEGERKQVTVLFADLKGSMELLAERDPEEARELLDPVIEHMMEAVHHYEGTVNQVMGDGIMALFGAPVAHEDHAVRACYAALRMQERLSDHGEGVRRTRGVAVQIRVGINSGEVVVRSIGSDLRMDYSAVGQTTHLAARMEQLAPPGRIRLTADTLRLAEGFVQVTPFGAVPVKGLDGPVEVYELIGVGPARRRVEAIVARGLTRFVGRDAEVEQLRQAIERASAGRGQVVALIGEPGVGKSRLLWEFTHSHRTHGWLVMESGAVSYGKAVPYLPVIDLLKGYFEIQDRDGPPDIRDKVIGKLLGLDRTLEPTLPALLALLDVPVDDAQWQALDPPQRRQRTLDGVRRLVLRESQVQPVLVVAEDLHWIDSETQAVLDGLAESLPAAHILMLVSYRPEYDHRWGGKTYYTQLGLDPLPPERAAEFLHALVGTDPGVQPLQPALIERTEGNPFFLEESVWTLVETGVLAGERGAYRLGRPLDAIRVPATIQAVLAARIDRLPPTDKRLLQAASVIGKDVPFALLQPIGELPEEALRRGLAQLQAAEFLYETGLFPELEYTFKHALTHEVAYQSLLHDRRRALHGAVVEAIERQYAERRAEHVERLAHHARHGELWERAVTYFGQAGTRAMARGAFREAVGYVEQALAALRHLPESPETVERGIDLRCEMQSALLPLGEIERMLGAMREAEPMASALGDQRRLGRVTAHMARCLWWLGEPEHADAGERALAVAAASGDLDLEVTASYILALTYEVQGLFRRAAETFQTIERLIGDRVGERFGQPFPPAVSCRAFTGWCLAELGEFAAATAAAGEGVRVAEAVGLPQSRVVAYWGGPGRVHLLKGEFTQALVWLERSLELCRDENFTYLLGWVAWSLGPVYARVGRVAEGLALLQQSAEQSAAMHLMARHPRVLAQLGEAHLLAGDRAESLRVTQRALEVARVHRQRWVEAEALRLLGEIQACGDRPDLRSSEVAYLAGLTLADELGTRPLAAHCHLGLGTLYPRIGKRGPAHEHLTAATTMYREMGMTYWLEQAQAPMAELG